MATPNYTVNMDDPRLTKVTSQEKTELTNLEKSYNDRIESTEGYYDKLIDNSKDWEAEQIKQQNEQTQFTIDKIEQQREQTKKDYIKEQSGAYADWQKQSNQYGVNAEQQAASGLKNTGYSESSQVSMYNAYQNRVASARESFSLANINFDNGIREAKLQNSSLLAEIHFKAYEEQLRLNLEAFQYKNTLLSELANQKMQIKSLYADKWKTVLNQINTENAMKEEVRQFEANKALQQAQLAEQKRQHQAEMAYKNAALAEEKRQFNVTQAGKSIGAAISKSSGGSSGKSSKSGGSAIGKAAGSAIGKSTKSNKTSNAPVDMQSVLDLGYGPISASRLAELENQGLVVSYVSGGKTKFKKSPYAMTQSKLFK